MKSPPPVDGDLVTRDRLIRAAVTLFQRRGYHGTGVSEILAQAGVPKGSLYHHFPDGKESLGIAALEWLTVEMETHLDRCATRSVPARRTVEAFFRGAADWLAENDYSTGALLSVMAQEAGPAEARLMVKLEESYQRVTDAFSRALATSIPPTGKADTTALAQTLLAALDGAVPMARAARSRAPILAVLDVALTLLRQPAQDAGPGRP